MGGKLVVVHGGIGKTTRLEAALADAVAAGECQVLRLDHIYGRPAASGHGTQMDPVQVLGHFATGSNRLVHSAGVRKVVVIDDYDVLCARDRTLPAAVARALPHVTVLLATASDATPQVRSLVQQCPPEGVVKLLCRGRERAEDDHDPDAFLARYDAACAVMSLRQRLGLVDACCMEAHAVAAMDWTLHKLSSALKFGYLALSSDKPTKRLASITAASKTHTRTNKNETYGIHPDDAVALQVMRASPRAPLTPRGCRAPTA